jgi:hypothetical protein
MKRRMESGEVVVVGWVEIVRGEEGDFAERC